MKFRSLIACLLAARRFAHSSLLEVVRWLVKLLVNAGCGCSWQTADSVTGGMVRCERKTPIHQFHLRKSADSLVPKLKPVRAVELRKAGTLPDKIWLTEEMLADSMGLYVSQKRCMKLLTHSADLGSFLLIIL
jgi:hypothetical protein